MEPTVFSCSFPSGSSLYPPTFIFLLGFTLLISLVISSMVVLQTEKLNQTINNFGENAFYKFVIINHRMYVKLFLKPVLRKG